MKKDVEEKPKSKASDPNLYSLTLMLFGLKLRFELSQTSLQLLFLANQIDFVVMPKNKSFWTSGGLCFVSSCSFLLLENSVASRIFIAIHGEKKWSILFCHGRLQSTTTSCFVFEF